MGQWKRREGGKEGLAASTLMTLEGDLRRRRVVSESTPVPSGAKAGQGMDQVFLISVPTVQLLILQV